MFRECSAEMKELGLYAATVTVLKTVEKNRTYLMLIEKATDCRIEMIIKSNSCCGYNKSHGRNS